MFNTTYELINLSEEFVKKRLFVVVSSINSKYCVPAPNVKSFSSEIKKKSICPPGANF